MVCGNTQIFFKFMAKSKEQKKQILQDLADKISKAKSVMFTKFSRLGVKENEELRRELKKEGSEYYVAKKTLMDLAFKDLKIDGLNVKSFEGQIAAVFGYQDEVAPAKIVSNFKKKLEEEEKVEFLGGILENKYIDAAKVRELASLPSKQELYAKIVGSINAPVSGFVNALAGNLRNLVYVLKAIEGKK
jgi:large subunit ribosomal protein L10